ncbi:site-2 protease family protein [Bacilliculturomica massiliensis]|uniref:site-2 protease family protein n=1 Tax=Bacilliculturomica massiliensis TaxID=1917867 RepID=UPI002ED6B8FB
MISCRVSGIKTEFHLSYFLLVAVICIFGHCILAVASTGFSFLHELAHAAAAKKLGYTPEKISAGLFGGVLHLRESVIKPKDQLIIHLAGPLFNIVCATGLYSLSMFFPQPWIMELTMANLILGLFNLMPFYPLDGGKLMNLYLAFFFGFRRAEQVSKIFSRLFSLFLFLLGIYLVKYNLANLLVSALGINLAIAERDDNSFLFYKLTKNIEVGSAGREPKIRVCRNDESALKILESYKPQENRLFTVVNYKGSYKGQLTEEDVLSGIYDCGIYADFDRLLHWKRNRNRKVE